MRRFLLLSFIPLLLLACSSVSAQPQGKGWHQVTTGVDGAGNIITTSVYGYYLNNPGYKSVLVLCDPTTGLETGKAYIPDVKVGDRLVRNITGYEKRTFEDWSEVKKINPVQMRLIAPNVFNHLNYTDYSWDYYEQTGQLRDTAYGPVSWPGSTEGYLIPGSDPDYWLIVAEVYNPNPWPVKARIYARLSRWRYAWYTGGPDIISDKEVSLGANETKYVLVNRGKPAGYYMIADDSDWNGHLETWAEAYYYTKVTENLDPELPESLKPNNGFISFTYYAGSAPEPNDLSGGFTISYAVDCREDAWRSSWEFDGRVSLTQNGWVAYPGSGSVNPTVAKQKVEQFFSSRSLDQIPYIDPDDSSRVIDGIRFYRCESSGVDLRSGPYKNRYDAAGPALVDYSAPEDRMDLNRGDGMCEIVSGRGTEIPVLKYFPIFVEFYRFVPEGATGEGRLAKEITPGYAVRASDITKPYFSVTDTFKGYTVEYVRYKSGRNWVRYWKININHHVTIRAVNPENEVSVSFSNVSLALPNVKSAVGNIKYYLQDRLEADVEVLKPNYEDDDYDPTFISPGTVNIGPGQTITLYDSDVTTEIWVDDPAVSWDYDPWGGYDISNFYVYIGRSDLEAAINDSLTYFNWNGEAAFVSGWATVVFNPNPNRVEQVLSLNVGQIRYRDDDEWRYRDVAAIDRDRAPKWLQPISYFKGEGFGLRLSDNVWTELLGQRRLSARVAEGDTFWPYATYDHKYDHWSFYQWREY